MWGAGAAQVDELKERIEEKDSELIDLKVKVKGVQRELAAVQIENERLKDKIVENMRFGGAGGDDGEGHSLDWISTQLDIQLDKLEVRAAAPRNATLRTRRSPRACRAPRLPRPPLQGERRRKLKFIHDEDRLVRHFEMSTVLKEKNKKRVVKTHVGVQTEEEEKKDDISVPPPKHAKKKVKGMHIPPNFRQFMTGYPKKVRNMTLRGLRRLTLQIFFEKVDSDATHDESNHKRLPMEQFIAEFMYHKYGLHNLADQHMTELIQTVRAFSKQDKRTRFFDLFVACSAHKNGEQPILPQAALDFVVDCFKALRDAKEVNKESLNSDPNSYVEIRRSRGMLLAKELFAHVAAPLVTKLAVRAENLPIPQSKDARKVSLDDWISLMLLEWVAERSRWEERLTPLFDRFAEVVTERQVADDGASAVTPSKGRRGGRKGKGGSGSGSGDDGDDGAGEAGAAGGAGGASGAASALPPEDITSAMTSTSITDAMRDAVSKACTVSMASIDATLSTADALTMEEASAEFKPGMAVTQLTAAVKRYKSEISLSGFQEAMTEAEPDLFEAKVKAVFEDARVHLEIARWERQRAPWKEAKDKATGHRYFYHEKTLETAWKLPDMVKERGTRAAAPLSRSTARLTHSRHGARVARSGWAGLRGVRGDGVRERHPQVHHRRQRRARRRDQGGRLHPAPFPHAPAPRQARPRGGPAGAPLWPHGAVSGPRAERCVRALLARCARERCLCALHACVRCTHTPHRALDRACRC